jgi:hypothetical protein
MLVTNVITRAEEEVKQTDVAARKALIIRDAEALQFFKLHQIKLPDGWISCRNWQELYDFGFSIVITSEESLFKFKEQLKIEERKEPVNTAPADPNVLGWGVWPHNSKTYIPGGIKSISVKFYDGMAIPLEMLSCKSKIGNFLHVDAWKGNDGKILLRIFTHQG